MKLGYWAALLAFGAAAPLSAQADTQSVSARQPAGMVIAMLNAGFDAELTTDEYGDPLIKSEAAGYPFEIYFYDCDALSHDGCSSVQLVAGFDRKEPWSAKEAIDLPLKHRFAAVTLDEEGDPFVRWDIVTEDGIPTRVFIKALRRFEDTVRVAADIVFAEENAGN